MSYTRKVSEVMVIYNDNEKTRKLVKGIREYIWDFFNKVKIESLDSFELYIQCDGLILNGEFVYDQEKGGNFTFGLNVKDEGKIMYILKNLELYTEVNVTLNYDGFFYYGHPYGVDRMSSLLEGGFDEQAVYMANEYLDSEHHIYMYEESEDNVIQGTVAPVETPPEFQIKKWESVISSAFFSFSDSLNEEEYRNIIRIEEEMKTRLGLELEYDSDAEIKDFSIDNLGTKNHYTYQELEILRDFLQTIVQTAPSKLELINLEFTFNISGEKDPFREISITQESEQDIIIGFYDPDSKNVRPYHSRINEMYQAMETIFGKNSNVKLL